MKGIFMLLTLLCMQNNMAQTKATTIYLIRHAEKADEPKNPELSEAGKKRAEKWAAYFSTIPIDLFFSSLYKRTTQTCTAIAASQNKEVLFYKPETLELKKLIEDNPGKTILIVGHSNTIPKNINQLTGKETYADIPDSEYGNLYIVKAENNEIKTELAKP